MKKASRVPRTANLRRGSIHLWQLASLLAPISLAGVCGYSLIAEDSGAVTARVIPNCVNIFSPANGEFKPVLKLGPGDRVSNGQLLGTLHSATLEREHKVKSTAHALAHQHVAELQLLRDHLRIRSSADCSSVTELSRQLCTAMDQLRHAEAEEAILFERIERAQPVVCPVNGRIIGDLNAAYVHEGDPILTVDPGAGYEIELVGPASRIEALLNRGFVHVQLTTPEGRATIGAYPIPHTLNLQASPRSDDRKVAVMASIRCSIEIGESHGIQAGAMGQVK